MNKACNYLFVFGWNMQPKCRSGEFQIDVLVFFAHVFLTIVNRAFKYSKSIVGLDISLMHSLRRSHWRQRRMDGFFGPWCGFGCFFCNNHVGLVFHIGMVNFDPEDASGVSFATTTSALFPWWNDFFWYIHYMYARLLCHTSKVRWWTVFLCLWKF